MTNPEVVGRLRALAAAASGSLASVAAIPVGVGWATVELERAIRELGEALRIPAEAFVPAPDSVALGARCRTVEGVLPGSIALVVLEPSTEGRLAASLARLGEGPAAVWLTIGDPADGGDAISAGPARPGPFGPERLIAGDPTRGPHRLSVGPPGTIRA